MVMLKNLKGQMSNQMLTLMLVAVVLVVGVFAFSGFSSGSGLISVFDGATKLADNTDTIDDGGSDYDQRDEQRIIDDVDIGASLGDYDSIHFNASIDADGNYNLISDNLTLNITQSKLENLIGNLDGFEVIEIWVNKNFDVEGFDYYFQAVMVKDKSWNKYQLRYSIGDNDFIINDLEVYEQNELASSNYFQSYLWTTINNGDTTPMDKVYVSMSSNDLEDEFNYNSLIGIDVNGEIHIVTKYYYSTEYGGCYTRDKRVLVDGLSSLYGVFSKTRDFGEIGCGLLPVIDMQFAVGELKEYSYDTIAQITDTRTTGFTELSFVKQELTTGVDTFGSKYFKILNDVDLQTGLDANTQYINDFMLKLIDENVVIDESINNPITLVNPTNPANKMTYKILRGEDDSVFDYKDITGLVLDGGYVEDYSSGTDFIETNVIKFDSFNSYGLRFSDLGLSQLTASQITGSTIGNIGGTNVSFAMGGDVYLVDLSIWDRILGSMISWQIYDFNGLVTFVSETWDNPYLINSDIDECMAGSCNYGFQSAFKDSVSRSLTFTTEKPINNLLQYNGDNYWLFWTLNTQSESTNGCIIFDRTIGDLGIRVPVSICDDMIGGSNSIAQIKLFSED